MKQRTICLIMAAAFAGSLHAEDRTAAISREAAVMRDRLVEMRRDFHRYPELSNREERTSKKIAEILRALQIPVETGVAKYGVVATIKGGKPGKNVAVRADIDALPVEETMDVPYKSMNKGVKHACGHDLHTTVALATAELLWKHRAELAGTVTVIFQPAEEGVPPGEAGGAPLMIQEGLLDRIKPAAMFALHSMPTVPVGSASYRAGGQMASSDRFKITVTGKQSHGAEPHRGIDPIVIGSQLVLALQSIASRRIDPVEAVVVTVGTFHGGMRFNIVAPIVEMEGTLRTLSPAVRDEARRLIVEISTGVAAAGGATATVKFDEAANPVLMNDEALSRFGDASLRRTLGQSNVRQDPPRMVAEDFAHFAQRVPSFYFFIGVGNAAKGITGNLHTAEFDIDEDALVFGTMAMTNLVWDFLESK